VHKNETDTGQKQEPAERIGGNGLDLRVPVLQDQDNQPAVQEHRDDAEGITDLKQDDEESDSCHDQDRFYLVVRQEDCRAKAEQTWAQVANEASNYPPRASHKSLTGSFPGGVTIQFDTDLLASHAPAGKCMRALVRDHTDVPREPPDPLRCEPEENEYPYGLTEWYRRQREVVLQLVLRQFQRQCQHFAPRSADSYEELTAGTFPRTRAVKIHPAKPTYQRNTGARF